MAKKPLGFLVIHGFSGTPEGLGHLVTALKTLGYPTLAPRLRGHGEASPEALNGIHWSEWVKDCNEVLTGLLTQVEKAIIIGHSMGGWIALNRAVTYGEKIDSIIIAGSSTRAVSPFGPGNLLNFLAPLVRFLIPRWEMPPVFADPACITHGFGYEWVPSKTWLNVFDFMKATEKILPEVSVPILILHSRNDTGSSPKGVKILEERISTFRDQKRTVWFEKTEHDMFNDCEREAVIQTVMDYVRERINRGTK
jgi:carboxylesterase